MSIGAKTVTFSFPKEREFNTFTKGVKPRKGLELEITLTDARTGQNRYFFVPVLPRRGNNTPWRGEFHCILMAERGGLYVNASEVDLVNRECATTAGDHPDETKGSGTKVYRFGRALEYMLGKRPNRFAKQLKATEKLTPPEPLNSDDLPTCVRFQQKLHVWYSRKPGHSYVQLDLGEEYTIYSPFSFTNAELSLFYSTKDSRINLQTKPLCTKAQPSSTVGFGMTELKSLAAGGRLGSAASANVAPGVDPRTLLRCETRLQDLCRKLGYTDVMTSSTDCLEGIQRYLDVLECLLPASVPHPSATASDGPIASLSPGAPAPKRIKREHTWNMASPSNTTHASGSVGAVSSPTSCSSMPHYLRDDMSDHSANSGSHSPSHYMNDTSFGGLDVLGGSGDSLMSHIPASRPVCHNINSNFDFMDIKQPPLPQQQQFGQPQRRRKRKIQDTYGFTSNMQMPVTPVFESPIGSNPFAPKSNTLDVCSQGSASSPSLSPQFPAMQGLDELEVSYLPAVRPEPIAPVDINSWNSDFSLDDAGSLSSH